jgi:hypothetical protein
MSTFKRALGVGLRELTLRFTPFGQRQPCKPASPEVYSRQNNY